MWYDAIFLEKYVDLVQFLSFFLEIFGFSLTYIEIRHIKTADKIENFIDGLYDKIHNHSDKIFSKTASNIFALFCSLLFFVIMPFKFGVFDLILSEKLMAYMGYLVYVFFAVGIIVVVGLSFMALGDFIKSLNNFHAEEKALGSFGLCIASIGIMGNLYQIIESFIH